MSAEDAVVFVAARQQQVTEPDLTAEAITSIAVPALLYGGTRDEMEEMARMARSRPDAAFVALDRRDHWQAYTRGRCWRSCPRQKPGKPGGHRHSRMAADDQHREIVARLFPEDGVIDEVQTSVLIACRIRRRNAERLESRTPSRDHRPKQLAPIFQVS